MLSNKCDQRRLHTEDISRDDLAKELTEYILSKDPTREQVAKAFAQINRAMDEMLGQVDEE